MSFFDILASLQSDQALGVPGGTIFPSPPPPPQNSFIPRTTTKPPPGLACLVVGSEDEERRAKFELANEERARSRRLARLQAKRMRPPSAVGHRPSPQTHPDVARTHTRSQRERERAAWLIVMRLAHRKNERMENIDHDSNLAKIALQRAHVHRLKACRATLGAAPAEQPAGRPLEVEPDERDGDPAAVLVDGGVPQRRPSPPVLQPLLPDGVPTMPGTVPGVRTEPRTKSTARARAPLVAPPRITLPMPAPAPPPTAAVDAVGAIDIAAARRSVIRQLNQQRSRRLVLPALPVPAPRQPGATIAAARRLVISQLTQQRSQRLRVLPPCHVAPGTPAGMADVDLLPPAVATVTPSVTTSTTTAAAVPSIGMVNAHHMYMVPAGC